MDLSVYVEGETDPSEIADNIWQNIGDCISGVWIFNSSTPHWVDSAFDTRLIRYQGSEYDVYIWGVQEDCLGRPN